MRRLPTLLFVAAYAVPVAVFVVGGIVFWQALACVAWAMGDSLENHLSSAALFILPAALLSLVAGVVLGRRGVLVLLVPLGEVVFVVQQTWGSSYSLDALLLVPLIAAAPYAVGWWVGWAIRVRRTTVGLRQVPKSVPNWTSPDLKRPT